MYPRWGLGAEPPAAGEPGEPLAPGQFFCNFLEKKTNAMESHFARVQSYLK